MKVDLHIGPHRTATTWIQWAAHRNRDALADRGILFINEPAQSNQVARALVREDADAALEEFDRLLDASLERNGARHPAPSALHSSEVFFEANRRGLDAYGAAFRKFVDGLHFRGHEVRLVFVERSLEDRVVSNAMLQVSLGNLQYLSCDPTAFREYVEANVWLKDFFFGGFDVAHLGFDDLSGEGDVFVNFLHLLYGMGFPEAAPPDAAVDARNGVSDLQVARGLLLAPVLNWVELFGSVPRFELFNASMKLAAPVSDASLAAIVSQVPMIRDCMRAMVRRAIEECIGA